eukprot:g77384.t1
MALLFAFLPKSCASSLTALYCISAWPPCDTSTNFASTICGDAACDGLKKCIQELSGESYTKACYDNSTEPDLGQDDGSMTYGPVVVQGSACSALGVIKLPYTISTSGSASIQPSIISFTALALNVTVSMFPTWPVSKGTICCYLNLSPFQDVSSRQSDYLLELFSISCRVAS